MSEAIAGAPAASASASGRPYPSANDGHQQRARAGEQPAQHRRRHPGRLEDITAQRGRPLQQVHDILVFPAAPADQDEFWRAGAVPRDQFAPDVQHREMILPRLDRSALNEIRPRPQRLVRLDGFAKYGRDRRRRDQDRQIAATEAFQSTLERGRDDTRGDDRARAASRRDCRDGSRGARVRSGENILGFPAAADRAGRTPPSRRAGARASRTPREPPDRNGWR